MSTLSTSSRDTSRDRAESRMVKHQHSFSESGRSSVPMWDSSDPDRAPPPLPLNPAVPGSPITRSNTSKRIDEAAALITARARENAPSSYTSNPPPLSPDRNMMRPQNKRVQNVQSPSVGRLSDSLERRSPDKGLRTSKLLEFEDLRTSRSSDRSAARQRSETPTPPDRHRVPESENTPPPANMLALQTMRNRRDGTPLGDITNGASSPLQPTHSLDVLSSQILSLTNIISSVQKEMTSLNKRSKDNYGDLMSLKNATTSRDEDIRKSLRDLVAGLETKFTNLDSHLSIAAGANRSANAGLYIEDKAHNGSPRPKSFGLPQIGSPTPFSAGFDRELTASPSLACVDGAASIALLEKVLREMSTREGQDKILSTLEAVKDRSTARAPAHIDPALMSKLEDILMFLRDMKAETGSSALVCSDKHARSSPRGDWCLEGDAKSGPLARPGETRLSTAGPDVVNEEVVKTLKSVKQSLAQGGGLTNEVKVLVRDLRGEVLGMGRELGRKLEQANTSKKDLDPTAHAAAREELATIVQQGLAELKEHMHHVVKESQRRSLEQSRAPNDHQELLRAMRGIIAEIPRPRQDPVRDLAAEREVLLSAVREAWEDCKPEIALEHFGLERDEILETLKEGLGHYQLQPQTSGAVTYEEILGAVRTGLAEFKPPQIPTTPGITQDDVLTVVRQCFQEFDWPGPPPLQATASEVSRSDVYDAVRDGLASHEETSRALMLGVIKEGLAEQETLSKEVEFNREDLFDAVKSCLEGEQNPLGGMGERVIEVMHEFLGSMRTEFQQYSAASGKDTEQVLDAMKDGLEDLRADIETYVDRAADVTGKDEIIDTVKTGFASLQAELERGLAGRSSGAPSTPELLDAMEKEFSHLRDSLSKSLARENAFSDKDEILDAIRDFSDDRQSALSSNSEDIVRLVKEELEHMRVTLAGTLVKSGSSLDRDDVLDAIREGVQNSRSAPKVEGSESVLSNTSELLDAFQDGVDGIRADIQKLTERSANLNSSYEILDALKSGVEDIRADIIRLHDKHGDSSDLGTDRGQEMVIHDQSRISTEIEGLKVMITQLRIKVEALGEMGVPIPASDVRIHKDDMDDIYSAIQQVEQTVSSARVDLPRMHKDDLEGLHAAISQVHDSVSQVRDAPPPEVVIPDNTASKDDTDAIETLLRNVRARLDEVLAPDSDGLATAGQVDSLEFALKEIKLVVEEATVHAGRLPNKEDLHGIESLVKDVQARVDEVNSNLAGIGHDQDLPTKTDLQLVESLCLDIKGQVDSMRPAFDDLANKEDIEVVKQDLKAFREQLVSDNELTAQAFEARKVEHGGLATKIEDVRNIVGDLRDEIVGKVDGSADGIVELHKILDAQHDEMSQFATAAGMADVADMIKTELDRHMDHHTQIKSEMQERDASLFNKHDDASAELRSVIEQKFEALMTKYDDAQLASDAKLDALESRDSAHFEATNNIKGVIEDVKVLMDTLGSTVTETADRISDDSKTVFTAIDESNSKLGTFHNTNVYEHGVTRDELAKTLATATRLEGVVLEHQPAVLAAINEVLALVGQHYSHSQQQSENWARATEEIKSGVDSIPAAIPPLLPPALPATPTSPTVPRDEPLHPPYDDSEVHGKLDTLLSHTLLAQQIFETLESRDRGAVGPVEPAEPVEPPAATVKLDEIHREVMSAVADMTSMVKNHERFLAEHRNARAAETTEATVALEKRLAQKDKVEADIVALNGQKDELLASMAQLRQEQEELREQTKRLTRDVAKVETALHIRQEEVREMNSRAEFLERRMFEGLFNHARSATTPKASRKAKMTTTERDASMSLKRVPSSTSTSTARTSFKGGNSTLGSAMGHALKKRVNPGTQVKGGATPRASAVDRRILSTSHVTGNRGRNTPEMALVLAPTPKSHGLVSTKRSHSVKSNPSSYANGRKASWNGVPYSEAPDKENLQVSQEDSGDEGASDASTERRTSLGTSYMYSDSLTYGTGSTVSGRSISCASSIIGTVNGQTESIAEESEDEPEPEETEQPDQTEDLGQDALVLHDGEAHADVDGVEAGPDPSMALTLFGGSDSPAVAVETPLDLQPPPVITETGLKYHGSDSGLGTEPLTASTDHRLGEAQEYFQMTAQEMQMQS